MSSRGGRWLPGLRQTGCAAGLRSLRRSCPGRKSRSRGWRSPGGSHAGPEEPAREAAAGVAHRGGDGPAVAGRRRGVGAPAVLPGPAGGGRRRGAPAAGGEFAAAAGLPADKAKVEGLRSKLKLLAGRGWLTAEPGGLLTLPGHGGGTAKPGQQRALLPRSRRCLPHAGPQSAGQ